jgi:hypothetical protein
MGDDPMGRSMVYPDQKIDELIRDNARLKKAIERMVFTPLVTDPPGDPDVIRYFERIQEIGREAINHGK